MKKIYTTPSLKEIALRCDGKLLGGSLTVNEEETEQSLSKDDDFGKDFGW